MVRSLFMNIYAANNLSFRSSVPQSQFNVDDEFSKDFLCYVDFDFKKKYNQGSHLLCPNALIDINHKFRYAETGNKLADYNKLSDFEIETVNAVDAAFDKLPPLTEDKTFFRALAGRDLPDDVLNAQKGDIIVPDKGYSQVALNQYYSEKYLPSEQYNPVLFEMKCPKGSKVSLSKHTGTGYTEGMLPRGTQFKILSKEKVNLPIVYADYFSGAPISEDRFVTKFVLEYVIPDENSSASSNNLSQNKSIDTTNDNLNPNSQLQKTPSFYTLYPNINMGKVNIKKYSPLDIHILDKISKLNNSQKQSLNDFLQTL